MVIGAPAPTELLAGAGTPTDDLLGCVEQAFRRGIAIAFDYRDRHGKAMFTYSELVPVGASAARRPRRGAYRPWAELFVPKQTVVEQILREIGARPQARS